MPQNTKAANWIKPAGISFAGFSLTGLHWISTRNVRSSKFSGVFFFSEIIPTIECVYICYQAVETIYCHCLRFHFIHFIYCFLNLVQKIELLDWAAYFEFVWWMLLFSGPSPSPWPATHSTTGRQAHFLSHPAVSMQYLIMRLLMWVWIFLFFDS